MLGLCLPALGIRIQDEILRMRELTVWIQSLRSESGFPKHTGLNNGIPDSNLSKKQPSLGVLYSACVAEVSSKHQGWESSISESATYQDPPLVETTLRHQQGEFDRDKNS